MILPHRLATTNDRLTSRAGSLAIARLMDQLKLAESIDAHFPMPKSNRGFSPSTLIQTLILMQHEGSFDLDEVRNLNEDQGLQTVLNPQNIPHATTLGAWLRGMGADPVSQTAWEAVNKR